MFICKPEDAMNTQGNPFRSRVISVTLFRNFISASAKKTASTSEFSIFRSLSSLKVQTKCMPLSFSVDVFFAQTSLPILCVSIAV